MSPDLPTEDFIAATHAVLEKETDAEVVKTYLSAWLKITANLLDQSEGHLKRLLLEHGQLRNDDLNETARSTLRWSKNIREQLTNGRTHANGVTKA